MEHQHVHAAFSRFPVSAHRNRHFPDGYVPRDPELSRLQKKIVETGIALLRDWELLQNENILEDKIRVFEKLCGVGDCPGCRPAE